MKLGKIEEVDIRTIWAHEQYDFSKWLAEDENIKTLGDVLGLSLTDVNTEQYVGSYRCDIICKDELTGKSVIIENQLEQTDHEHLGKVITYASGLDASVVVWIAPSTRAEHASAIEWLNKHTDEDVSFFLIEIHIYKIGSSEPAPMFKIIEQPNDFVKTVKMLAEKGELKDREKKRLEYWTLFNDIIDERGKPFNKHKPSTDHWYTVAVGSSKCHISIDLVNKDHKIRVGLWIDDSKELYDRFYENKDAIEQAVGARLEWDRLDNKKASVICICIPGLDFSDTSNYTELMNKSIDIVIALRKAFAPYLF